ncbi:MAG: PKD domain-containing protein [Thermoplasmatota archaeon]
MMKRTALLGLTLTIMLLLSGLPVFAEAPDAISAGMENERNPDVASMENTASMDNVYYVEDLVEMGYAEKRVFDVKDPENPLMSLIDTSWLNDRHQRPMSDLPSADEEDTIDTPFFLENGDKKSNNVSATISGTSITFDDEDFYQINLSADGVNRTADQLELTVFSQEAVNKDAYLTIEILVPNYFLGRYEDGGFEIVGAYHGNTSRTILVPDSDPTVNLPYPVILRIRTWNNTMLNFTVEAKITQTSRTEWNGLFGGGFRVNSTNKPSTMQSVNRSHDMFDWFDLTGLITDTGINTARGDVVEFSMRVDIATEERGLMYNPYGLHGTQSVTSALLFCLLAYLNYTSNQINLFLVGTQQNQLPIASALANSDPRALVFRAQVDHAWVGVYPLQTWITPNSQLSGGATGNGEVFYNLTSFVTKLIPPNDPPSFNRDIDDYIFNEDEGPFVNVTNLNDHFSDPQPEHDADLHFEVARVDAPDEIQIDIANDGQMSVRVTEPNYHGYADFRIICNDWGRDWVPRSGDEIDVRSNLFRVTIAPVNDDAYIERIDTATKPETNTHQPIHITIPQNYANLRDRKIYAKDNDTEDQNKLEYSHNATTPRFTINTNGQYSFVPNNDDVGTHWIKITVDDGHSPSEDDYCILVIHITNKNDAPVLRTLEWRDEGRIYEDLERETEPTFRDVQEDLEINLTVVVYDPDIAIGIMEELQWNLGSPGWEVHPHYSDPLKAYITYTPTNDDALAGGASTTLQVIDSQNAASQEITIILYVKNRNDEPIIRTVNGEEPVEGKITLNAANGQNGFEDRAYTITVVADDIDPRDEIRFSTSDSSWQQTPVQGNDFARNFTILPTQEMVGNHTLRITVTDESDKTDSVMITYQIVNTNDAPDRPTMGKDQGILYAGDPIHFYILDSSDPDGDALKFVWDFGDGTQTVVGDEVTHTYQYAKSYTITLYAQDPTGAMSPVVTDYIILNEKEVEVDPNLDSDGDGMNDTYEEENGLDKYDPNDKYQDMDNDGFTNFEEFQAGTNPLDPRDHPPKDDGDSGGISLVLIIILIVIAVVVLAAIGFFIFALTSKPKKVTQQQMYAPEMGLPPGMAPQLNQQQVPQMPPARKVQQLPPAEDEKRQEEEELLGSFMEEAHKEMEVASQKDEEEENVWRPPVEEEVPPEDSHVDDLFGEGSEEQQEAPKMEEGSPKGPPKPPSFPDLPPLPDL